MLLALMSARETPDAGQGEYRARLPPVSVAIPLPVVAGHHFATPVPHQLYYIDGFTAAAGLLL